MATIPTGFHYFIVWEPNGDKLELKDSSGGPFCDACKSFSFAKGQGAPGRTWEQENTAFIPDVQALGIDKYPRLEIAKEQGIHSTFLKFADGKVYEYVSTDTLESAPAV